MSNWFVTSALQLRAVFSLTTRRRPHWVLLSIARYLTQQTFVPCFCYCSTPPPPPPKQPIMHKWEFVLLQRRGNKTGGQTTGGGLVCKPDPDFAIQDERKACYIEQSRISTPRPPSSRA